MPVPPLRVGPLRGTLATPSGLEMRRPGQPRPVSRRNPQLAGSVEDPRPSRYFAKRSGGSIELLGPAPNLSRRSLGASGVSRDPIRHEPLPRPAAIGGVGTTLIVRHSHQE